VQETILELYDKNVQPQRIYDTLIKVKAVERIIRHLRRKHTLALRRIRKYPPPIEIAFLLTGKKPENLYGTIDYEPFSIFPTEDTILARELLLGILTPFTIIVRNCTDIMDKAIKVLHKKLEPIFKHSIYDLKFEMYVENNTLIVRYEIHGRK